LAMGSLRLLGTWGILVYSVLLSEAVNANRIDFRNVYTESVYFIVGMIIAASLNTVLVGIGKMGTRDQPVPAARNCTYVGDRR